MDANLQQEVEALVGQFSERVAGVLANAVVAHLEHEVMKRLKSVRMTGEELEQPAPPRARRRRRRQSGITGRAPWTNTPLGQWIAAKYGSVKRFSKTMGISDEHA